MKISFIRHGKTQGNFERRYIGATDQDVSPIGITELKELVNSGVYKPANRLYVSPMKRCLQTAEIIYPGIKPVILRDFREISFGDFENKTFDEIISIPGYENFGYGEMIFPGGEPVADFSARVIKAFTKISETREDAVVIAHGGVIMAIASYLLGGNYYDWHVENGRGYTISVNGKKSELLEKI